MFGFAPYKSFHCCLSWQNSKCFFPPCYQFFFSFSWAHSSQAISIHHSIKTALIKVTIDPPSAKLNKSSLCRLLTWPICNPGPHCLLPPLLLESLSSLGFHDTKSPDSHSVSLVAAFLDSVPPHFLNLLKLEYPRTQPIHFSISATPVTIIAHFWL